MTEKILKVKKNKNTLCLNSKAQFKKDMSYLPCALIHDNGSDDVKVIIFKFIFCLKKEFSHWVT